MEGSESVASGEAWIGTSGWHYKHWKGRFYPENLREPEWFAYYRQFFDTVELNNSFYHLPLESTFDQWREAVPEGFLFAVKASRYITHMKKLKDPKESIQMFFERVVRLENHLGPILFQLPPHWGIQLERLEEFLQALPQQYRYAFEFRDPSWFQEPVYELLRSHNAAFCIYHLAHVLSPVLATTDFIYLRLHGPGGKYQGSYSVDTLHHWAQKANEWRSQNLDFYCYFDNDDSAYAIQNARALKGIIDTSTATSFGSAG